MNTLVIASANPVQKTLTFPVRSQKSLTTFALWETAKPPSPLSMPMPLALMWVHAAIWSLLIRTNRTAEADHVREFGVYTKDHQQLIDHLRLHGITTIAMESTGSYWQTLFNALQQAGFEVMLVSGSQTKNVKAGRPVPTQN